MPSKTQRAFAPHLHGRFCVPGDLRPCASQPQPSGSRVLVAVPVGSEALVILLSLLLSGAPGIVVLLVQLTELREDGPHAHANA